jgi:ketopantoate reductase
MKIAVIGSGGVGGYFGARLAASGSSVTFVYQTATLRKADKFRACCHNCIAVHPTELSDTFMVWIKAPYKPHQLDVATALSFQTSRRAHLVEIAV